MTATELTRAPKICQDIIVEENSEPVTDSQRAAFARFWEMVLGRVSGYPKRTNERLPTPSVPCGKDSG